jgi:hypothetical protein
MARRYQDQRLPLRAAMPGECTRTTVAPGHARRLFADVGKDMVGQDIPQSGTCS